MRIGVGSTHFLMIWIPLAILFVIPAMMIYFIIIRSVDRYAPEPLWVLFLCLVWGAVGAVIISMVGDGLGQWFISLALQRPMDDETVFAAAATFVAPPVEEFAKALGLLAVYVFARRRVHETHGPLDGVVYGGIIGLGFSLSEDIIYIIGAGNESGGAGFLGLYFFRTILLGFGHATFTALTGLGFGLFVIMKSGWRWLMPLLGLAGGMLLHFGRNLFASFLMGEGIGLVFVLLLHALVMAFFFGLLIWLGLGDRKRVINGLQGLVGVLISREEYNRIISPWMLLPGWNVFRLTGLPGGYWAVRKKQLNLFKLAFIRNRVRHEREEGDGPPHIDPVEAEATAAIQQANDEGVRLAPNLAEGVSSDEPTTSPELTRDVPSGQLALEGPDGRSISFRISTVVGKSAAKQFGEDSQFWSEPQFTLDRTGTDWQVIHASNAQNETLLNGKSVSGSQLVKDGDVLAVGRESKGIIKLPLKVKIS